VKAELDFAAGQASATFSVPIVDHGIPGLSKTIEATLFARGSRRSQGPISDRFSCI
jgi:hypothetical protein